MKRITKKVLASILTFTIAFAQLSTLGMYGIAYATEIRDTSTSNSNVEFDVYFANEEREIVSDVNAEDMIMYLNIKVKEAGYLKNGIVSFSSANFNIKENVENEYIQETKEDKIYLKQLDTNSNILIELPITAKKDNIIAVSNFTQESKVQFNATYVNSNGKEVAVEKEHTVKLLWNGEAKIVAEATVNKYVPYKLGEEYGIVLQYNIKTGLENNNLPIKTTELKVKIPQINEKNPTNIRVLANNTKATNGKTDGIDFLQDNWNYDAEEKTVSIKVENIPTDGNISWAKKCTDEYLVTFVYEGKEIYDYANATEKIELNADFAVKIEAYNNVETIREQEFAGKLEITEKVNDIVDFNLVCTKEISKGYIYANYDAKEKIETPYTVKYTANIAYADLINVIEITQENDNYKNSEAEYSTIVSNKNDVYTKQISIPANVFNKILGTEGYIDILNVNEEKVATINSENLKDNAYILDCSALDINKLKLKTSAPITEGTLVIYVEKAVKGQIGYNKEEMKDFEEISTSILGKTELAEQEKQGTIKLIEPVSKAELTISKQNLSTVTVNENVEIRTILDTSSIKNSLFKNPTVKLVFPEYFTKIEVADAKLLFEDELKLKENKWSTENGKRILTLTFEGTQTKYSSEATTKGATISIVADITLNTLTPAKSDKIVMYYTNENTNLYEQIENGVGVSEVGIKYIAPTGLVAASGISNYAEDEKDILSISNEKQVGKIAVGAEAKTATIKGLIINNNNNSISNTVVLGRLPFKGNKQIDTTTDLETTFDVALRTKITLTGVAKENIKIYYSENGEATKDLEEATNAWTLEMENLEKAKSYLIVLENTEIDSGKTVEFTYDVEIPANLAYNNNAYTTYKVYYDNNEELGTSAETKLSSLVGISTGEGPKLKVTLSSNMPEGSEVREGQIVRFTATVENIGEKTAEDVVLNIEAPENTTHVEYNFLYNVFEPVVEKTKQIKLGNIESGKTIQKTYELKINKLEEIAEPIEITNKVKVAGTTSNEYKLKITKGYLQVETYTDLQEEQFVRVGSVIKFKTKITAEQDLSNVVLKLNIPVGTSLVEIEGEENTQIIENELTYNLGDLSAEEFKYVIFILKVNDVTEAINVLPKVSADNIPEHYSNIFTYYGETIELEIEQKAKKGQKQTVKEGENIEYIVSISNIGKINSSNNNVEILIPEGTKLINATYKYNDKEYTEESTYKNKLTILIDTLKPEEKIDIEVKLVAKELKEQQEKEIIIEPATLTATSVNQIQATNKLKFYVQPSIEERRYKITGTAWLDENKNGIREETETLLSNMQVMLVYKETGAIVTDTDTYMTKKVTTDENGKYEFLNLEKGEYLVVFLYDTEKYIITEYNTQGVDESINSDAIEFEMELEGKMQKVAISDVIKVEDTNIRDIDIGLCIAEKFDLKLDKYINKITLTTPTIGTQVYNKNNEKLSKVEVLNKNVGQSSFVVEYKIVVTNEGSAAGYVKKVVDYLPKEAKFNSELNKDWFLAKDGNAYNSILADVKLETGQSKELTLILSYNITESLIGSIINNNAEIYESYNEQGLQDIDSKAGNKISTEDDISNADIAVSIVTGKIVGYTTLTLFILGLLGFGIYEIKKQVLDKKI